MCEARMLIVQHLGNGFWTGYATVLAVNYSVCCNNMFHFYPGSWPTQVLAVATCMAKNLRIW